MFDKKVNFIIALGSAGYDMGKTILERVQSVDLVINGGGKSVLQYNGMKGPLNEAVVDPYPYAATSAGITRLLATTSRYGKYLGNLEMTIEDAGRIKNYNKTGNPILLNDIVPEGSN